mmetsp:Transcript_48380/g.89076  ORF Transcript_48380/g.89076 Transcript_48380/m.89076 type:complete len:222 (-) Transcript_48380:1433-2098(-)
MPLATRRDTSFATTFVNVASLVRPFGHRPLLALDADTSRAGRPTTAALCVPTCVAQTAASLPLLPRRCLARHHSSTATVLAQSLANLCLVDHTAVAIMAKSERASAAARCKRIASRCLPRGHGSSASRSAEALSNTAHSLHLNFGECFCPSVFTKLQLLVCLHALSLLILPAHSPTVLCANLLKTCLVLFVPGVAHESGYVFAPADFSMYLRLLVLHLPNL